MTENMTPADFAAMSGGFGGGLGGGGMLIAIIILLLVFGKGFGGGNNQNAGVATSNEVQRGFDNQNAMANQREILSSVTAGTAQAVAATNQAFHDNLNVIQDKYGEITRDIYGVSGQIAQVLANQNECCCSTKMLMSDIGNSINANIAQSRYDSALNTAAINANITNQTQKVLDVIAQNRIETLQGRVNQLELQAATQNVLRYPTSWTYNAGMSPFCNSGCGCSQYLN